MPKCNPGLNFVDEVWSAKTSKFTARENTYPYGTHGIWDTKLHVQSCNWDAAETVETELNYTKRRTCTCILQPTVDTKEPTKLQSKMWVCSDSLSAKSQNRSPSLHPLCEKLCFTEWLGWVIPSTETSVGRSKGGSFCQKTRGLVIRQTVRVSMATNNSSRQLTHLGE